MRIRRSITMIAAAGALAACAASRPSWDRMNAPEKLKVMRTTFMPEMKAAFVRFDPHRYPKMGCSPCHAKRSNPDDYRMPNPNLRLGIWDCHDKGQGEPIPVDAMDDTLDTFMRDEVVPLTARLLGRPVDAPGVVGGVGCFDCHEREK